VKGSGVLQPGKKVKVGDDVYEAKKAVVIATGSRVKGIPPIGLEINKTTVISSDEALLMEKIPASLAIIGAGAVGMEFADIFNAFGVKVTVIEALPRILPLEDAEASDVVSKSYRKRAIEDIAGPPMLAHKGSREGVVVAEILAGQKPHPIKYDNVPSVTYCHPEVASIGLTEDQCKEKKLDYVAGKFPFSANGRARGTGETEGFV